MNLIEYYETFVFLLVETFVLGLFEFIFYILQKFMFFSIHLNLCPEAM